MYEHLTFRFSVDYPRDDWSPCSSTSVLSSPPSTPPLPFYDSAETDENAEDNYSPVCSDTEWGEYEEGILIMSFILSHNIMIKIKIRIMGLKFFSCMYIYI